jgi:hypothetical protein
MAHLPFPANLHEFLTTILSYVPKLHRFRDSCGEWIPEREQALPEKAGRVAK